MFMLSSAQRHLRPIGSVTVAAAMLLLAGCNRTPSVGIPQFDPEGAAAKALEQYDTDGDGYIAGEELENAPGLKAALKTVDDNQDGQVSEIEVANRVRELQNMKIGLMTFDCSVSLDGMPLQDATVTFDPEEFLADTIKPAIGMTSVLGTASPIIPKELRPSPDSPPGIQAGLYKVRISKIVDGKETIPQKYNSETILGQEVSRDDSAIINNRVQFDMKSK